MTAQQTICYLCGRPLSPGEAASKDHVMPQLFITRDQPRAKGFEYGGFIRTHETCNNRFKPESYMRKALELIELLTDPRAFVEVQHKTEPDTRIMGLDATRLTSFTDEDRRFFKMIDVRDRPIEEWSSLEFLRDKPRTNLKKDALTIALSVVAKSASALVIDRGLHAVPDRWHIHAVPHLAESQFDLRSAVDETVLRFDEEVDVAMGEELGNWTVIFRFRSLMVPMVFRFHRKHRPITLLSRMYFDADIWEFRADALNEMLKGAWKTWSVSWVL
jgi:hypothetical protein